LDVLIKEVESAKIVCGSEKEPSQVRLAFTDRTDISIRSDIYNLFFMGSRPEGSLVEIFQKENRTAMLLFGRKFIPGTIVFAKCNQCVDGFGFYDYMSNPTKWRNFWRRHIREEKKDVIDRRTGKSIIIEVNHSGKIL